MGHDRFPRHTASKGAARAAGKEEQVPQQAVARERHRPCQRLHARPAVRDAEGDGDEREMLDARERYDGGSSQTGDGGRGAKRKGSGAGCGVRSLLSRDVDADRCLPKGRRRGPGLRLLRLQLRDHRLREHGEREDVHHHWRRGQREGAAAEGTGEALRHPRPEHVEELEDTGFLRADLLQQAVRSAGLRKAYVEDPEDCRPRRTARGLRGCEDRYQVCRGGDEDYRTGQQEAAHASSQDE
mmetsp:Transcript_8661/g.21333  ORF Transcript_8661/g.21333 Transcript_8661/m.21333 type:complete len:241 (-) Transcript_8661:662-1384(-)